MLKALFTPIFFKREKTDKFNIQLENLKNILGSDADFLSPVPLGDSLSDCDAVIFPEVLGEAYRNEIAFSVIDKPIFIITSDFGTVSMWDWEIANYLKSKGIETIRPYNINQAKLFCRMLATKRKMYNSKFLIFQDNPGEGFQPSIFKSFYWWEDECTKSIKLISDNY